MSVKTKVTEKVLDNVLESLDKDFDKNFPEIIKWAKKMDVHHNIKTQLDYFENISKNPDNNWYKYLKNFWATVDPEIIKHLITSFVINENMIGGEIRAKNRTKYNCNIPWAILMDPTSACNLHCIGCWAAEYGNKLNMTLEDLDSVIKQGTELGTYLYLYSGGEPLVRKNDIITLCERHPECIFTCFTNGTLIDDAFAKEMLRVKNFVPAISIEGFEEATDFRRGKGTYQKVLKAMKILRENKLPFGISCCYTSKNYDVIGSEEYFDSMIEMGAKFAWFFTYMPVGKDAVPELMVTDKQREFMYHKIRDFRHTKQLFTMDFWNDGEFVGGCIAGGRSYLHINAGGDMEPCAFIHYSNCNIHSCTLIEALQSPLFMEYKKNQPFNKNMLRPCPLLDNYGALAKMVDASKAESTDLQNPENVHDLCDKCKTKSEIWAKTSAKLWEKSQKDNENK
jgi:MoaA/NifB/PqqE/SkfB family radical SAM enzyme